MDFTHSRGDPCGAHALRGSATVALSLPKSGQEIIQSGAVSLETDPGEQAGFDSPNVREAVLHLSGADTPELRA